MNKFILLLFVFLGSITVGNSQQKKEVLLSVNGKDIYASEFKRVYKKNLELVEDESQKSVDGYLDLFIDYQLKIAEAYDQKLDTKRSYLTEFSKYQEQLSRNYLFEDRVTEDLVKEAHERGKESVEAEHILILSSYEDQPQDTLAAYNKAKMVHAKALAGEDFKTLIKTYSEEPNAVKTEGYLGWFSVFRMVYPFESMAYNTKVGAISDIVRTQFGYHIIHVLNKRKTGNKITVSHIMISDKEDSSRTFDPKERIEDIYARLQQGESFESLAKQFSEDIGSLKDNGKLRPIARGDINAIKFEEEAFKLKEIGEISKPVKSRFGWHIIRLEKIHPIPSLEDERQTLENRVKDKDRMKIVSTRINDKIKTMYGFQKGEDHTAFFNRFVTDSILKKKWRAGEFPENEDKMLFKIGDKKVMFSNFATYIEQGQMKAPRVSTKEAMIKQLFDDFETETLKTYFMNKLEEENEEYATIINEYRYGLLIFELMESNIWNEAKKDTVGLKTYFEANKENYRWKKRVYTEIFSFYKEQLGSRLKTMLSEGISAKEIKELLNTNGEVKVIVTKGIFEEGSRELPEGFNMSKGVSPIFEMGDSFVILRVEEVLSAEGKKLEEVKGRVLSEYQNVLEDKWMQSLKNKYKVEVNKKTLKKIKKELGS